MSARRKELVTRAFALLDTSGDGVVTVDEVASKYDASRHPDVRAGRKTTAEVLTEFIGNFEGAERDGKLTRREFEDYYANVSASIDDDNYFALMVCACARARARRRWRPRPHSNRCRCGTHGGWTPSPPPAPAPRLRPRGPPRWPTCTLRAATTRR